MHIYDIFEKNKSHLCRDWWRWLYRNARKGNNGRESDFFDVKKCSSICQLTDEK